MRESPVSVVMIYWEVEVCVRERVKPEDIGFIEGRVEKEAGVEATREEMYWQGRVQAVVNVL